MARRFLSSFLDTRWALLVMLIVFVCFKIPHLFYPYYCDESWVYVRAIKTMAINGPSLLPGSIPAELSRGHPLLFHFLCSLWIRCFGPSNVAVHLFPLLVSVLFLISIYEGCRRLFGSRAAALVILLISTNVFFFVQSAFLFPEIMLAMFAFLSLYYYVQGRLLLTSVMLLLLFFTKESGLVFGAVIGSEVLFGLFSKKESNRRRVYKLTMIAVPTLLAAAFFVLQKAEFGWYILPDHTVLIHTDWNSFYFIFRQGLYWIFRGDAANYILAFFIIILSVIAAGKLRDMRYLFLFLPAAIIYILTNNYIVEHTGDVIWMVLFALFFIIPVYYLLQLNKAMTTTAQRFTVLMGICFVIYLCYLSLTMIGRYIFADIVFVLIFLGVCIDTFVTASGPRLTYIAIAGILVIGAYAFYCDEGNTDGDLEAFHAMKVQENVISYLEKDNANDKEIVIGCFWAMGHFTDTMQGYLTANRPFTRVKHEAAGPNTEYAIFDNFCGGDNHDSMLKNPDFHLAYKTTDGKSWSEVYKRNHFVNPKQ